MKVYLDMIGCRLNQAEIEIYASQLRNAGHTLISSPAGADLVIVNTCTVTAAAASDSRQKIRQATQAGAHQVVVTGCHATQFPLEISSLSGVYQVFDNRHKDDLVPLLLNMPVSSMESSFTKRQPIPGTRMRTRAFIKVQDGCDNHCTYCITRLARGKGRSRSIQTVLADIQSALAGEAKEIVLTGVHLGSWGSDFEPPSNLKILVSEILDKTDTTRLHLSSIEPWDITTEFFDIWQDRRLCRHLHLPLQSGCAATLQRMGRKIRPLAFAELVQQARRAIPGVAITTDVITGFPGETEEEFSESKQFIESLDFSTGHVFTYSPRPGTAAALMPGKIPFPIAKRRNAVIRQVFQQAAHGFLRSKLGCDLPVLWEKAIPYNGNQWQLSGLSDNYIRVHAMSPTASQNQISLVHITGLDDAGLVGDILPVTPAGLFK